MAAGIIALCDEVTRLIEEAWEPGLPNEVERLYVAPVTVDELSSLVGRKVYVFPGRKLFSGMADRGSDIINWSIGILCVERNVDAGILPKEWMDVRVEWQEAVVEDAVDYDGRTEMLEFADGGVDRFLRTLSIETEIYDVDLLEEKKLFYSTMEVVFEEIAEA